MCSVKCQIVTQGGRYRFRQGAFVQCVTSHGSTWAMDAATCVRMRGRTANQGNENSVDSFVSIRGSQSARMTWLQPSSGVHDQTHHLAWTCHVVWLEALATTPEVYLHLAGKFSRIPPHHSTLRHMVDERKKDSKSASKK